LVLSVLAVFPPAAFQAASPPLIAPTFL
jgi:hypothetical protein